MTQLPKQLTERLGTLPNVVQKAIIATEIRKPLMRISEKHALMLDQISALEGEVILVMTGMAEGSQFVENIVKEVGVNEAEAISIAEEIEQTIFEDLRENIQRLSYAYDVKTPVANVSEAKNEDAKNSAPENLPVAHTEGGESDDTSKNTDDIAKKRMLETMSNPHKKIDEEEERKDAIKRNYPQGSDPYRESVE